MRPGLVPIAISSEIFVDQVLDRREWIYVFQARKPVEVAIVTVEGRSVLDSKRRQIRVHDERSAGLGFG